MATAADWMSAAVVSSPWPGSSRSWAATARYLPHGVDGRLRPVGPAPGAVPAQVRQVHRARLRRRPVLLQTARVVAVVCAIFVSFTYVAARCGAWASCSAGSRRRRRRRGDPRHGHRVLLRRARGHEGHHVHAGGPVLRAHLRVHGAGHLSVDDDDRLGRPQIGLGAHTADGAGEGPFLLDRLDGLSGELGFLAYTSGQKSKLDVFFIAAALMTGTAGLPHVIVRFYTVAKVKAARSSAGFALFFIAILYTTAPAVAAFARTKLLQSLKNLPYADAPAWFKNWESTGLIKFIDENGDGLIQYVGPLSPPQERAHHRPRHHGARGARDRRAAVLGGGAVAAGGLAAALSTAAGLLLVISTSVAHDLMKRSFRPDISEKEELRWAASRRPGLCSSRATSASTRPGSWPQVVAFAFGLAASSFFPAIVLGIFVRRMNREGAVTGMITGLGFTAAYIIWFKFLFPETNDATIGGSASPPRASEPWHAGQRGGEPHRHAFHPAAPRPKSPSRRAHSRAGRAPPPPHRGPSPGAPCGPKPTTRRWCASSPTPKTRTTTARGRPRRPSPRAGPGWWWASAASSPGPTWWPMRHFCKCRSWQIRTRSWPGSSRSARRRPRAPRGRGQEVHQGHPAGRDRRASRLLGSGQRPRLSHRGRRDFRHRGRGVARRGADL